MKKPTLAELATYRKRTAQLKAWRRMGIANPSHEAFERFIEEQEGACAACGLVTFKLVLDFDRSTGQMRGAVCESCQAIIKHLEGWRGPIMGLLEYMTTSHPAVSVVSMTRIEQRLAEMAAQVERKLKAGLSKMEAYTEVAREWECSLGTIQRAVRISRHKSAWTGSPSGL